MDKFIDYVKDCDNDSLWILLKIYAEFRNLRCVEIVINELIKHEARCQGAKEAKEIRGDESIDSA